MFYRHANGGGVEEPGCSAPRIGHHGIAAAIIAKLGIRSAMVSWSRAEGA